jgi:hypothetical protein
MLCVKCGGRVPEDARFCPNCGASVTTAPSPSQLASAPPGSGTDDVIIENKSNSARQVDSVIPLHEGEGILWHREVTQGLLRKEVVLEEAVTNQRCIKYDVKNRQIVAQVGIDHRPEVVVMNRHRVSNSIGGGVFLAPRMFGLPGLGGFGAYGGPRRGNIKISGDASIISDGKIILTFENIQDPHGVRMLVEALKREAGFMGPRNPRRWLQMREARLNRQDWMQ